MFVYCEALRKAQNLVFCVFGGAALLLSLILWVILKLFGIVKIKAASEKGVLFWHNRLVRTLKTKLTEIFIFLPYNLARFF